MACLVSAFVSSVSADASSELISCCSLAFFFFSSSIWSDNTAFLFLFYCSGSAFFSLILQGTSCISVWHYLQPGVTVYRLHQPGQCHPHNSHVADNSLGNKSLILKVNFFSLLVYWKTSLQLLDRVKEQATFWQHSTMNAAARLILHKRKYDHITSDIRDRLHWLPIQQRLEYNICLLIFKCLHQMAPVYLTVMSDPVSASASWSHLRSTARGDLAVPRSQTMTYRQRSFSVSGSSLWNSLPLSVRDPSLTMMQFCTHLNFSVSPSILYLA